MKNKETNAVMPSDVPAQKAHLLSETARAMNNVKYSELLENNPSDRD